MILVYKYRVKDRRGRRLLRGLAVACNQVWNYCVETQRKTEQKWRAGEANTHWLTHFEFCALTAGSSKELGVPGQTIQSVSKQFVAARGKKHGTPKFRASSGSRAARGWVPFQRQTRRVSGSSVTYANHTYRLFGTKRRPIPDTAGGGAFVEDAQGHWWVCFHVEVDETLTQATNEVGIDLGLKTLATMSDGTAIPMLHHYRRYEKQLKVAQRARNKRKVKAIHAKIANARRDQHHKATTKLVQQNRFIAVGDVNSSKLAKTRLAKSVFDAGWAQFRSMLLYKARLRGVEITVVKEAFSTQTCSKCGAIGGPKGVAGLGIRSWTCPSCGAFHDRDVNAAKNILNFARSASRPAEGSCNPISAH
jgi:IS605 OrfB family transposase